MNTDQAYIMGLVVGGGCFSSDHSSFHIRLPYRQWGDVAKNPARAGVIANDILHVVKPLMNVEYGLDVSYVSGREWKIVCSGNTSRLIADLRMYGIEPTSDLHKTADLSKLIASLTNKNMKKRFVAGIADTIGSMAPSQRRFSDDVQIISFEISGFNYNYVCELCRLLYDVGCVPDQILWQHPNMQSGTDSYYKSWKKGNKLRVTLDSFSTFGSLAFKSKAVASQANRVLERPGTYNAAVKCEEKSLSVPGVVAVHVDENFSGIPEKIRGGHYIHHKQICAALGCEHAPYHELDRLLKNAQDYVCPFTVLHKGKAEEISGILLNDPLLNARTYVNIDVPVSKLVTMADEGAVVVNFDTSCFKLDRNGNIVSKKTGWIVPSSSKKKGYPISVILDAVNFVICSKTGNLNGNRPRGNRNENIMNAIDSDSAFSVAFKIPDLLTPLIITDGKVSAMVGPMNADVYKRLISYDTANKYKMVVRKITESDLR